MSCGRLLIESYVICHLEGAAVATTATGRHGQAGHVFGFQRMIELHVVGAFRFLYPRAMAEMMRVLHDDGLLV